MNSVKVKNMKVSKKALLYYPIIPIEKEIIVVELISSNFWTLLNPSTRQVCQIEEIVQGSLKTLFRFTIPTT
jgi:hypothetical protein